MLLVLVKFKYVNHSNKTIVSPNLNSEGENGDDDLEDERQ